MLGRIGGAVWGGVKTHVFGWSVTSYAVTKSMNQSLLRLGIKNAIASYGMKTLAIESAKGTAKSFVLSQTFSISKDAVVANFINKDDEQAASKSPGGACHNQPSKVEVPYARTGSALPRDTIRPLLKDGSNDHSSHGSSFASGQSIAEGLNLDFRCSYGLSRREPDSSRESGIWGGLRSTLRSPPDWNA